MKHFQTDLKTYTEKVRLKAAERRELRERILAYMEYHPLPKKREQLPVSTGIASQPFWILHFNSLYVRTATAAFALILFVGVPMLAERSLPGDALYLVKTGINESIRATFADSPYEKIAYETTLIERRIAEARLLASEGKLTEEVEAQIVETVKGHADAAQSGIAALKEQNADDAAIAEIALDSALQVQSAVLDTNTAPDELSDTSGILTVVNSVREEVNAKRGTTTPSYEGLSARIEQETTRAHELFKSIQETATSDEIVDIERRLSDIDRKVLSAQENHDKGPDEANGELVAALGLTQKLIAFMTDIDVRETVALETLVPVELTLEERTAAVELAILDIQTTLATVSERMELIGEEDTLEKVTLGYAQVLSLISEATTTLSAEEPDIAHAEARVGEAKAIVVDLDALTAQFLAPENEVEIVPEEGEVEEQSDEDVEIGTTTPAFPAEIETSTEAIEGEGTEEAETEV